MSIMDVEMFALSAAVLYIKFLVCTMIQGRKAFAAGTRMAEDNQLPQAKNAPMQGFADLTDDHVRSATEDEMRWKRIIQNDLESMPMAYVVFWSAICVDVNASLIKTLLLIYTIARIGHTVVYSQSLPRARMIFWMTGMVCIIIAASPILMVGAISDVNAFGLAASALYVKFVVTSMLQARTSFIANTRMAEDKQLVCAMGISTDMDDKALKVAKDNEQRWRRIVQNDLESIPLSLLVFWGAIQNGVSPDLIKTLLLVYTTARFGHTIAYGMGAARSRMACWMSGTVCVFTAAVNMAMIVLA